MAKRPNLTDINNVLTSASTHNANNDEINQAFDNTLSRDGSTPNQMEADFDMNSNDILNARDVGVSRSLTVKGVDILESLQSPTGPATVFNTTNRFSGDGSTTTFTLTKEPVARANTHVFIQGVYQNKDQYVVSGTTLVFNTAPGVGTNNIEVIIQEATDAGTIQIGDIVGAFFTSRSDLVTWWSTNSSGVPNGVTITVAGDVYLVDDTATGIPDMPGLTPAGDVCKPSQFGAVGDTVLDASGVIVSGTDDTTALQAALDWMSGSVGRRVVGNDGAVYQTTAALTGTGHFDVELGSARIVCSADVRVIDWSATLYGPFALGADYTTGSLSLNMTGDPLPFAPQPGQVMKIMSDAVDPGNRDSGSETEQYRIGEFFVVGEGSTTTNIVLDRPLRFTRAISPISTAGDEAEVDSYLTSNSARVLYADMGENFILRGGIAQYEEGHEATWSGPTYRIRGFVDPLFENARVERAYGPAFRLQGTYGATVLNCSVAHLENDTSNGQFGYGVADAGWFTKVIGLRAHNTRHPYTSSVNSEQAGESNPEALISVGRTVGAQVIGGHATGGTAAHWDTHHSSDGVAFRDVYSERGGSTAAALRGRQVDVLGITCRNQQNGLLWFTEYQSGDADDDFFTAGKTKGDFTSGVCRDPDIECTEVPVDVSHASVVLTGAGRFVSQDHCSLYNTGGVLIVDGHHEFTVTSGGVTHSNTGCIQVEDVNAAATAAITQAMTVIEGTVVIDARDAGAATVNAFDIGANSALVIRGRLKIQLPAGAGWQAGGGEIRCEGDGVIEFEIDGAADNTIITDASDLENMRIQSIDGTVVWDDAKLAGGGDRTAGAIQTFMDSSVGVSHEGTGAMVDDVYVPEGQYIFDVLDGRGAGMIRVRLSGRKTGTAGAAVIGIESAATNFVHNVNIGANDDFWQIEMTCYIQASSSQLYVGVARIVDSAGPTITHDLSRKAETVSPNVNSPAFTFGVDAVATDFIHFDTCEIWATAGGTH